MFSDLPKSQGFDEFFGSNACHFECTSQGTKGDFPVHRNDATALTLWRDLLQYAMAAALPINKESQAPERFDSIRPGNDWQISHVLTQRSGLRFPS